MKLSREIWQILGLLLLIPLAASVALTSMAAGHYFAEGYENDFNITAFFIAAICMAVACSFVVTKVVLWGDKEYFKELKVYKEKIEEEKLKDAALNFYSKISDCRTKQKLINRLEEMGFKKSVEK